MGVTTEAGRIVRVNGPVVHVTGLDNVARFEYIEVGHDRLPGEVLTVDHDLAVAELFEYTGGLAVGEPVWASGRPLSVELGPDLLGGIFDGLLRPLIDAEQFLTPRGLTRPARGHHHFEPATTVGAEVASGDLVGTVRADERLDQLVLVPHGISGVVERIASPGSCRSSAPVASIGGTPITLVSEWPIRRPRPHAGRLHDRTPFVTGQRVLDIIEPIAKGSSATVIGGFGEGKTMLLEQLAKWGNADVIIYVGCGERGNELADLIEELAQLVDPTTSRPLLERTIILANTSNMPVMAREASIYTAVTVAEYFRDMGYHAVIIADSTSRWAEAQRELASRTGAIPAEQGYPADLPASLAAFYQRAGRVKTVGGRMGTVTIVSSVSPPGGDLTEPVAAHTQRFVQAVWVLDRDLAYSRHYPAVSWTASFSRDSDALARWHTANGDPQWVSRRARMQSLLAEAARLQGIAELVGLTALPTDERIVLLGARLVRESVLQQSALSPNDASCSLAKQTALSEAVLEVYDTLVALGRAGTPASIIEEFDYGPLLRAKDSTGSDDAVAVQSITVELLEALKRMAP